MSDTTPQTAPGKKAVIARWPNDAVGSSIGWLKGRLESHGIAIRADCALHAAFTRLDELKRMLDMQVPKRFASLDDMVKFNAEADGVDFLSKMLHRAALAGLVFEPRRWRDLVGGSPIPTLAAPSSRKRNMVWEMVLAGAMATFCKNVRFAEPDVMGEFEGKEFGVAAKVAYSGKQLWENVDKGAAQANGRSDAAIIFVNVVNLLPMVEVFQASQSQGDAAAIDEWIKAWACRWYDLHAVLDSAKTLHQKAKSPTGVAFFMPFVVEAVDAEGRRQPLSCFYTHMPIAWREDDDSPDYRFACAFLQACNTVLGFQVPKRAAGTGAWDTSP